MPAYAVAEAAPIQPTVLVLNEVQPAQVAPVVAAETPAPAPAPYVAPFYPRKQDRN